METPLLSYLFCKINMNILWWIKFRKDFLIANVKFFFFQLFALQLICTARMNKNDNVMFKIFEILHLVLKNEQCTIYLQVLTVIILTILVSITCTTIYDYFYILIVYIRLQMTLLEKNLKHSTRRGRKINNGNGQSRVRAS